MHILCDTGSIIMVIRIAPDMFINPRFQCVTIIDVRNEIFNTQRFKKRYSWRETFGNKIIPMGSTQQNSEEYKLYLNAINSLCDNGVVNRKTRKFFDLSRVDKIVAAIALANKHAVTTTDKNLIDFLEQEFQSSIVMPLGLINVWLKAGLIVWNGEKQLIMEDWSKLGEPAQKQTDIDLFEKLTGFEYCGL